MQESKRRDWRERRARTAAERKKKRERIPKLRSPADGLGQLETTVTWDDWDGGTRIAGGMHGEGEVGRVPREEEPNTTHPSPGLAGPELLAWVAAVVFTCSLCSPVAPSQTMIQCSGFLGIRAFQAGSKQVVDLDSALAPSAASNRRILRSLVQIQLSLPWNTHF